MARPAGWTEQFNGLRPEWMERAKCKGMDPSRFVKDVHEAHGRDNYTYARTICKGCPVIDECLAYALANPRLLGFWGGKSPNERRRMRHEAQKEMSA